MSTTWKIKLDVPVVDNITGFRGIVTGRAEYSTGCKQYCVTPKVNDKGEILDSHWFDEDRLAYERLSDVVGESSKGGPQAFPAPTK